ncbi:zinc finger BED domain-containing protein RICESLEEPER 2-like [Nicotiana tomentosiformis]|uniref:zinc finger BED domain-containing protein RICESLEEPER 2-like n=1 Tax=Nicotiana tomentosiformis TaxID=4098 RepID=UPI00388C7BE3
MVITAHWIDDDWNFKKKILNIFQTSDHKGETIAKGIEACLLDWGSSAGRFDSFKSFVEKAKIDTHGLLTLDVETRWNSTYMMLDTAVKFEHAFSRIYDDDHKYLKYCSEMNSMGGHPSIDDWKNVKVFIKFLEIFYQNFIQKYSHSEDSILSVMAEKMKVKFKKYWSTFESMNKLLFVAVVLDPRYKLKYVEFLFNKCYGSLEGGQHSKKVMDTLTRLYGHYKSSFCETSSDRTGGQTSLIDEIDVQDNDEMWQSVTTQPVVLRI